jgi:hypothetical protein
MPLASAPHFINDLRGLVWSDAPSADPYVNAVLRGEAELLGKGDDGVAFRVGDKAVKVSTVVPYQPTNPGYLSPEASVRRAQEQHATVEAMRHAGVTGLLPERLVVHAHKAFTIKPFVELPERLSPKELAQVARSVESANAAGWAFDDTLQVGRWDGAVWHFDTGKARRWDPKTEPRYASDGVDSPDVWRLRMLFRDHGAVYLTEEDRRDPSDEAEAIEDAQPETMSPSERQAMRSRLLKLRARMQKFERAFPTHRWWRPSEEFIRRQMERFR